MLVIGLVLSMFGIGVFCWLIFTLAVYALPFVVGLSAGIVVFHSGAGVLGALIVGSSPAHSHLASDKSHSHSPDP